MTGPAFLLAADQQNPLVAAVTAEGFEERVARDAVASITTADDPTASCGRGVELSASDD